MRRRMLVLVVGVSLLAALFSACGGSGDGSSDGTAASGSETSGGASQPSGKPIKVMVIAPYDNPILDWSMSIRGAEAGAEAINAEGGVGGRPIEIVPCNDGLEPNKATRCAREAVSQDVTATVFFSLFTAQIFPVLDTAGIPGVGSFVSEDIDSQAEMAYPIFPGSNLIDRAWPGVLKNQGFESFSGIVEGRASTATDVEVMEEGAKSAGIEMKGSVGVPPETTDYSPFVQQLAELGGEATVGVISAGVQAGVLTASSELGFDKQLAQLGVSIFPSLLKELGPVADGQLILDEVPPASAGDEYPSIAQFNEEMDAAGMDGVNDRNTVGIQGWFALHAIALVAEQVSGEVDAKSLVAQLDTKDPVDLLGLLEWTPGGKGPAEYHRLSNGQLYEGEVKGGEIVLTNPEAINGFAVSGLE